MVCGCYYSVRGFHRGTHVLLWCVWDFLNFALMALGVKPKASCMLGKPCNTEVCFFPLNFFFFKAYFSTVQTSLELSL